MEGKTEEITSVEMTPGEQRVTEDGGDGKEWGTDRDEEER